MREKAARREKGRLKRFKENVVWVCGEESLLRKVLCGK